jgi:predicted MFS family arabinose efflux permease
MRARSAGCCVEVVMPPVAIFAILIASVTALPANVLPVTLGLMTGRYDLDPAQIGYLVATNTLAGLCTSLSAPLWVHRFSLRPLVAIFLIVMALGLLALGHAPGLPALFAVQVVLGVTGVGIASICVGVIARLENPARAYGFKITADVIIGGSFLALVPVGRLDLGDYVLLLAAPFLAALPLVRWLEADQSGIGQSGLGTIAISTAPRSAWLVLVAMVVFYVAGAGMWPFLERLGLEAGLDQGEAANMIAAGLFVGMAGSLGAVAVAGRVRGIWPQTTCGIIFMFSIPALAYAEGIVPFAAAVFVFNAAWNFFIPFVVALVAARDTTRRLGALVPGTAMLGGIIGPPLAGNLIGSAGYEVTTLFMMGVCGTSILAYVLLERVRPPREIAT